MPAAVTARRVLVNGEHGIVVWNTKTGKLLSVTVCAAVHGRIVELLSVDDPGRLAAMAQAAPQDRGPPD